MSAVVDLSRPRRGARSQDQGSNVEARKLSTKVRRKKNSSPIYIADCRPYANALGNVALGFGWENMSHYKCCSLGFLSIANIHVVRESLRSVKSMFRHLSSRETEETESERYDDILEAQRNNKNGASWFKHLSSILQGVAQVVDLMLVRHSSVLVHCSDGWDRTPQITSLVQLLLDPYYRTLKGFAVLISKDWASYGHKFAQRYGHLENRLRHQTGAAAKQKSPVFLQWLDCVYQLVCQFPSKFEFNSRLLPELMDKVHCCRFGDFLFNTEREREQNIVRLCTISFWSYVLSARGMQYFVNPAYRPCENPSMLDHLSPKTGERDMRLFMPYFKRWDEHRSAQDLPSLSTIDLMRWEIPPVALWEV